MRLIVVALFAVVSLVTGDWSLVTSSVFAATKVFSGGGDGALWHDADNWFAVGAPALTDAVTIDKASASVTAKKDFAAQSVTLGGKTTATWTADNFIYGTITPSTTSDPAILIRKNGTVVMKGAGVVTLKGPFKNTEESLPTEPSVMVLLE